MELIAIAVALAATAFGAYRMTPKGD